MKEYKKHSVCFFTFNDEHKVLATTRKYDFNDWGVSGGKCESFDMTYEDAIKREVKEETGFDVINLIHITNIACDGRIAHVYTGDVLGEMKTTEKHLVGYVDIQKILDGSFGELNRIVLGKLGILV